MSNEIFTGWDIGGAHLKLACVTATGSVTLAMQIPMPLWQGIHMLDQTLSEAQRHLPLEISLHTITTTAELVDIFKDRYSGIKILANHICKILSQAETRFYAGRSGLISTAAAARHAADIASANWHATAAYVASIVGDGILIDIGSTTTDIIMFNDGQVRYHGYTDFERLASHELVYTGIIRTPVMAVSDRAPLAGKLRPLTAEVFATMADVYRLTGELQVLDDMLDTPDGCDKTLVASARRLARMFGADLDEHGSLEQWQCVASCLARAQLDRIDQALHIVRSRRKTCRDGVLVGAGTGRFLGRKLARRHGLKYMDFADLVETTARMKGHVSVSAAAVSVAQLARLQS